MNAEFDDDVEHSAVDPLDGDAEQARRDAANAAHARVRDMRYSGALVAAMATADGRLMFWRLLARCGVFRSVFDGNPLQMAFNEGGRNRGLELYGDLLAAAPDQFARMQKENEGET